MRIISKFKDYYDNAICYSYCDHSNIYVRNEQEYIDNTLNITALKYYPFFNHSILTFNILGFCGKFYLIIDYNGVYYININDLIDNFKPTNISLYKKYLESVTYENPGYKKVQVKDKLVRLPEKILNQFLEVNSNTLLQNLFIKYGIPYFLIKLTDIYGVKNPKLITNFNSLKTLKFYKVFNANQTYQELEMFFNSVLVRSESPAQILDSKVLITAKGFDVKTSFRHPIKV